MRSHAYRGTTVMKTLLCLLSVGFLFASVKLSAAPALSLQLKQEGSNGLPLCGGWVADGETLVIEDHGKVLMRHHFCSSVYSTAEIVTDGMGQHYIFLTFGTGHGTNAVEKYLEIYELPENLSQIKNWGLYEYMRLPIYGGAGATSQWVYHYQIAKPPCGGLRLTFTRAIIGGEGEIFTMPAEKTRVIEINVPSTCPH